MPVKFTIIRAKPNPVGKDTSYGKPLHYQLMGEWIDIRNDGDVVSMTALTVTHDEYDSRCARQKEYIVYWQGKSSQPIRPGEILRVHAGYSSQAASMLPQDAGGAHHHAFTEQGHFILNNRCGDRVGVWTKDSAGQWQKLDEASYSPNPPEGAILTRIGVLLV